MRAAQALIQKNKFYELDTSSRAGDPLNYETRLLNDNNNYALSPAAKRAKEDGSLNPASTHFNRTFNRKIKMRDTFTKLFPTYTHGTDSCYQASFTHYKHFYPKKDDLGQQMQAIDRTHTHKMD